jgi:hypothetical protein
MWKVQDSGLSKAVSQLAFWIKTFASIWKTWSILWVAKRLVVIFVRRIIATQQSQSLWGLT